MEQNILHDHITRIFGIEALPLDEQAILLSQIGDAVFQASLVRFISTITEAQQAEVEAYLAHEPEPDILLAHLLQTYPTFETVLETVVYEFKADAQKALNDTDTDVTIIDA